MNNKKTSQFKAPITRKQPHTETSTNTLGSHTRGLLKQTVEAPSRKINLVQRGSRTDINTTCLSQGTKSVLHPKPNETLLQSYDTSLVRGLMGGEKQQSSAPKEPDVLNQAPHMLAYNAYLQAVFKQEIVKKENVEHQSSVNDQFLFHLDKLNQLKEQKEEIEAKIAVLEEKTAIMERIKSVKENIADIGDIFLRHNPLANLGELSKVLETASKNVSLNNVKTIENQEECNQFMSIMKHFNCIIEGITNTIKDKDEINQLANHVRNLTELQQEVVENVKNVSKIKKTIGQLVLKTSSDMFASKD
ncbi:myosin-8-like [Euwallacea similis]|uniref:myosin-8-like n=1 Tax=Euwallacea similis TaxID=1736056 RepID=UPI003450F608